MHTAVRAQIDRLHGLLYAAESRFAHYGGRRRKRDHGTVVIDVRSLVEYPPAGPANRICYGADLRRVAAFGEVRHALHKGVEPT
jgi:hypothetical protein